MPELSLSLSESISLGPPVCNYWDNSDLDGDGNNDNNWSLGHVPTENEIACFDDTSDADCTFTGNVSCDGVYAYSSYDGNLDFGDSRSHAWGDSGFVCEHTGNLDFGDGTAHATTGPLDFADITGTVTYTNSTWTLNGTSQIFATGSSYQDRVGHLIINGTYTATDYSQIGQSLTVNNGGKLTVGAGVTVLIRGNCQATVNTGGEIDVLAVGTFWIYLGASKIVVQDGTIGGVGILRVTNIDAADALVAGTYSTAEVLFEGNGTTTGFTGSYTFTGNVTFSNTSTGTATFDFAAGAAALEIQGSLTIDIDDTGGIVFDASGSPIILQGDMIDEITGAGLLDTDDQAISFTGTNTQNIAGLGYSNPWGVLTVNKVSGAVNFSDEWMSNGNITFTSATLVTMAVSARLRNDYGILDINTPLEMYSSSLIYARYGDVKIRSGAHLYPNTPDDIGPMIYFYNSGLSLFEAGGRIRVRCDFAYNSSTKTVAAGYYESRMQLDRGTWQFAAGSFRIAELRVQPEVSLTLDLATYNPSVIIEGDWTCQINSSASLTINPSSNPIELRGDLVDSVTGAGTVSGTPAVNLAGVNGQDLGDCNFACGLLTVDKGDDGDRGGATSNTKYLSLPADSALDMAGDFTIAGWIRRDSGYTAPTYDTVINIYCATGNVGFFLHEGRFDVYFSGVTLYPQLPRDPGFWKSWRHVMLIRSGTTLTTYVDGVLQQTNNSSESITATSMELAGSGAGGAGQAGTMAEWAKWDRALNATERAQLVAGTHTPDDLSSTSQGWYVPFIHDDYTEKWASITVTNNGVTNDTSSNFREVTFSGDFDATGIDSDSCADLDFGAGLAHTWGTSGFDLRHGGDTILGSGTSHTITGDYYTFAGGGWDRSGSTLNLNGASKTWFASSSNMVETVNLNGSYELTGEMRVYNGTLVVNGTLTGTSRLYIWGSDLQVPVGGELSHSGATYFYIGTETVSVADGTFNTPFYVYSSTLLTLVASHNYPDVHLQRDSTLRLSAGETTFASLRIQPVDTDNDVTLDLQTNNAELTIDGNLRIDIDTAGDAVILPSAYPLKLGGDLEDYRSGAGSFLANNQPLTLIGSFAQDIDFCDGAWGDVTVNKSANSVTQGSTLNCGDFTGISGSYDPNAQTIEASGDVDWQNGFAFDAAADAMNGCAWNVGGNFTAYGQTLRATAAWTLSVTGTATATGGGRVAYSDANGGTEIKAAGWADDGENYNWDFIFIGSLSCSVSESHVAAEWRDIGVDQPPGAGTNYPFIRPEDNEEYVIGDLFLRYRDDDCQFELPFHIEWLYNFGCAKGYLDLDEALPARGIEELVIHDANGQTVFDTRESEAVRRVTWGPRAWIIEWRRTGDTFNDDQDLLRIVRYIPSEDDDPEFPRFIRPTNAVLDGRAVARISNRVTTIAVDGSPTIAIGSVGPNTKGVFAGGYNTEIGVESEVLVDAGLRRSTLTFDMDSGLGLGRYEVNCDDITDYQVKRINNISPADHHDFTITTEENSCLRVQRPMREILSTPAVDCRTGKIQASSLQIDGDCGPCCDCDDFIGVYESVRKLSTVLADYFARAQAIRTWLNESIDRMEQQRDCRALRRLRVHAQAECPDKVGCSLSYCNSTEQCIKHVLIPVSFDYQDTLDPDIKADTYYTGTVKGQPGEPCEICGYTKRAGNVIDQYLYQAALPYVLGGTYPHYWAYFDAIEPYSMGFITFFVEFPESERGNTAAFAADAYSLPEPPVVSSVEASLPYITNYGYVIGSGPSSPSAACLAWRLVQQPVVTGAAILQEPCCVDDLSDFLE